jgi:SAM-dependent methyltransferase
MEITEQKFWDDFWGDIKLPVRVDYKFKNDRVIAGFIKKFVPYNNVEKTMFEVGCAPGKWLIFFNKELNYKVFGLEYIESAAKKTRENLVLSGVSKSDCEVINADFLNYQSSTRYDVVCSLGFIEHFTDWRSILDKHIEKCRDSGYIVIGMPRFRGINYALQKFIDNYIDQPLIPNHNLEVMDLEKLKEYAGSRDVQLIFLDYVGGFEPALFNTRVGTKALSFFLRAFIKGFSVLFGNFNSRYTSSYIMLFMKKR